jgi:ParB family transcriptional regulator, chromosome partitioning protein
MTRRKLSTAIASREELSFVFGAKSETILQATQTTQEQQIPRQQILCSFTFVPDGKPVRYYYDEQELQQWAQNDIKPNGIRSALWVRPHPHQPGKYELVAGLRRFKSAEILDLPEVPAKVFDWDDNTAFQAAIAENSNRRDFNPLEELDNTIRLLEIGLGYDTEDVIRLLYRMNNAAKGTTNQNVLVSSEAEQVKNIFDTFSRITWQSFVATRLSLLKKPPEVLDQIRQGKMHYTKAILISGIKDQSTRKKLLKDVLQKNFTTTEVKQKVKQLSANDPGKSEKPVSLKQRFSSVVKQAGRDRSLWDDPAKTRQIENLLATLERLISSSGD